MKKTDDLYTKKIYLYDINAVVMKTVLKSEHDEFRFLLL